MRPWHVTKVNIFGDPSSEASLDSLKIQLNHPKTPGLNLPVQQRPAAFGVQRYWLPAAPRSWTSVATGPSCFSEDPSDGFTVYILVHLTNKIREQKLVPIHFVDSEHFLSVTIQTWGYYRRKFSWKSSKLQRLKNAEESRREAKRRRVKTREDNTNMGGLHNQFGPENFTSLYQRPQSNLIHPQGVFVNLLQPKSIKKPWSRVLLSCAPCDLHIALNLSLASRRESEGFLNLSPLGWRWHQVGATTIM